MTAEPSQNEENIQYVLRVTQLDSKELDDLLLSNLKQSINQELFKYIQINFIQKYNTELITFIKLILWYTTYHKTGQTAGQSILDWSYLNGNGLVKKLVHCIFYCFDDLIEERIPELIKQIYCYTFKPNQSDNHTSIRFINKYIEYFRAIIKLASFFNYLAFLYNGKYIHLWQRFVKMRPVYNRMQFMRENDTKINEREELWQSYFVLFKLVNNLVNFKKLMNFLSRKFNLKTNNNDMVKLTIDIEKCGICKNEPTMVHCSIDFNNSSACKHVFCYYCIKKYLKENNNQYFCSICSKYVNNIEIYMKNSNI